MQAHDDDDDIDDNDDDDDAHNFTRIHRLHPLLTGKITYAAIEVQHAPDLHLWDRRVKR